MRKLCILPFLLIFLFACNQPPKQQAKPNRHIPANRLITAGKSIGKITINEVADSVYRTLGKPDAQDAAMGKSLATWYAGHDTSAYQTQLFFSKAMGTANEASHVKQIRITSPWFQTANGIGTLTPLRKISIRFPLTKIAEYQEHNEKVTVYDSNKGIAFEINNDKICTGIIVYEGASLSTNYMPFHTGTK